MFDYQLGSTQINTKKQFIIQVANTKGQHGNDNTFMHKDPARNSTQ